MKEDTIKFKGVLIFRFFLLEVYMVQEDDLFGLYTYTALVEYLNKYPREQ